MNAKSMFLIGIMAACIFAQSDQKFKMYGFADMTLTKYFPKENSSIRGVTMMDERFMASFDHLNLYQEFRPNNRVRFLTEFSYQDKPPTYVDQTENVMEYFDPAAGGMVEMVTQEGSLADTNKFQKGIVNYEWGSFSVERAQMSVYLNRYANLTFGKFITPAGIWNVDHGSPVIMTVNQPSQYTFREIYPKSQLGIMESGTYFAGDVDLNYTVYLSTGRGNPIINKPGELAAGGQLRIGVPVLDELNIGISGYTGNQTAVQRKAKSVFTMDGVDLSIIDNQLYRYRENVMGADFRLRKSVFMLQSEFNYQLTVNKMREDWPEDSINTHIIATYVLASVDAYRNKNFMITPYAFYEYVRYFDTYNNPNLFLDMHGIYEEGTPNAIAPNYFNGYMKIMAGLNMRMFMNFGIKTEFNFTRIFQSNQDFADPTLDPNELAEDPDGLLDVPGVTAQFYIAF